MININDVNIQIRDGGSHYKKTVTAKNFGGIRLAELSGGTRCRLEIEEKGELFIAIKEKRK